jgi:hypothetical protein
MEDRMNTYSFQIGDTVTWKPECRPATPLWTTGTVEGINYAEDLAVISFIAHDDYPSTLMVWTGAIMGVAS